MLRTTPVLVDQRRCGSPAVALAAAVLLLERVRPHRLAVAIETHQQPAHHLVVDVAGLGIAGRRGPAHAVERHRGQVEVEAALPDRLAGLGVEGRDHRLAVDPFAHSPVDVDPAVHDHRGRAAGEVAPPDQVLALRAPTVRQALLRRDPVLARAAPGGPFLGCRGSGNQRAEHRCAEREESELAR